MRSKDLKDKKQTAFRLSDKAKTLLRIMAKEDGVVMTAFLENAIRQIAKERNVAYKDTDA